MQPNICSQDDMKVKENSGKEKIPGREKEGDGERDRREKVIQAKVDPLPSFIPLIHCSIAS